MSDLLYILSAGFLPLVSHIFSDLSPPPPQFCLLMALFASFVIKMKQVHDCPLKTNVLLIPKIKQTRPTKYSNITQFQLEIGLELGLTTLTK
ncbi:hypothetical protein [Thiolapillus sp.]|uniref:hypothetical protein n=2 Tax=Thiolapillus sp. TaxID=2017437 RepID=UPI003AF575A9